MRVDANGLWLQRSPFENFSVKCCIAFPCILSVDLSVVPASRHGNERILLLRSRVLRFQRSSFASLPGRLCSQTELRIREVARLRLRNCVLIQGDYGGQEFNWAQSLAKDG